MNPLLNKNAGTPLTREMWNEFALWYVKHSNQMNGSEFSALSASNITNLANKTGFYTDGEFNFIGPSAGVGADFRAIKAGLQKLQSHVGKETLFEHYKVVEDVDFVRQEVPETMTFWVNAPLRQWWNWNVEIGAPPDGYSWARSSICFEMKWDFEAVFRLTGTSEDGNYETITIKFREMVTRQDPIPAEDEEEDDDFSVTLWQTAWPEGIYERTDEGDPSYLNPGVYLGLFGGDAPVFTGGEWVYDNCPPSGFVVDSEGKLHLKNMAFFLGYDATTTGLIESGAYSDWDLIKIIPPLRGRYLPLKYGDTYDSTPDIPDHENALPGASYKLVSFHNKTITMNVFATFWR